MPIVQEQIAEWKAAYRVLDVPTSASANSIKLAYRKLLKRWHPDFFPAGSVEQNEATQMSTAINAAFAKIERAPLRYFHEPVGLGQNVGQSYPQARPARKLEPYREPFRNTDLVEAWIRFFCGAVVGAFFGVETVLRSYRWYTDGGGFSAYTSIAVILGFTFVFGVGAMRKADRFWRIFFGSWWRWG